MAPLGSLSSDRQRFMAWRTIDGVALDPIGPFNELQTLVRGVLAPACLPDYLRFFVLFEDGGGLVKLCADIGRLDTLVHLACQELEAWYLGDLEALAVAYEEPKLCAPAPPRSAAPSFGATRLFSMRAPSRAPNPRPHRQLGMSYTCACSVCGKLFKRTSCDATLNPHKNKQGRPCPGWVRHFGATST